MYVAATSLAAVTIPWWGVTASLASHSSASTASIASRTAAGRLSRVARSMSSTAPWKKRFHEDVSQMKPPAFVLGTVASAPQGSPVPYVPRVRYCVFRGFWAELAANAHNDAERNPRLYESDCPTFTTDVRMEKVGQIFATSAGHAASQEQTQGSGGGGPVEAVYWIAATGRQWRIKGRAYVIADDIEAAEESSGVRTVKSEVGKRMRVVDASGLGQAWSWQKELTGFFGNQSPGTRGTVRRLCRGRWGGGVLTGDDQARSRTHRQASLCSSHLTNRRSS